MAVGVRRISAPTESSPGPRLPGQSPPAVLSSEIAATKHRSQREGREPSVPGADVHEGRPGQPRCSKPPHALTPSKDRRRTTTYNHLSPKKTLTPDKAFSCEWTAAAARRYNHQPTRQRHRKKMELLSSSSSCAADHSQSAPLVNAAGAAHVPPPPPPPFQTHPPQGALRAAAKTTSAPPVFTAVPAAGLLLHGAVPVNSHGCQGGVAQPVDTSLPHRYQHQHVLIAEQQTTAPCTRVYRSTNAGSAAGNAASGWRYTGATAAAAPAMAQAQPAVCREYLLFGPSSFLLFR